MEYAKKILCLANSRKLSGRCIAGKERSQSGFGEWIRPVSARSSQEISEEERRYENGESPAVLDVINVPMHRPVPKAYQSENHLIDDEYYWRKIDTASWAEVEVALDRVPGPLWVNGHSTYEGLDDKIPEAEANQLASSLLLIRPANLRISVDTEGGVFGPRKRKVRASFFLGEFAYTLAVTDPVVERNYLAGENGLFPVEDAILCISLGEIFNEYAFKIIAAVITPDMGN